MDYGTRYMHRMRAKAEEYRKTPEFLERERLMNLAADRAEKDLDKEYPNGPTFENAKDYSKYQRARVAFRQKELGLLA